MRSPMTRLMSALAFVLMTLIATQAFASSEEKITIKFLGFGANPDFYGVLQKDEMAGDVVMVYQIGVPTPIASMQLEGISADKALVSAELSSYAIGADAGTKGATAAQGYTLTGQAFGAQYQLSLSAGGQSVTLGYVSLASDPGGTTFATGSVKDVYWSADGMRVVVVLNQKLKGEWGMNTDFVAAYLLAAPAAADPAAPAAE